jgi:hypothetical protein
MAVSFGLWVSGMLWLVVWNAWVGVFATGTALGLCVLENATLAEWLEMTRSETEELEKQVVSLRTTIDQMARDQTIERLEHHRSAFRARRSSSACSL